jgi:hypothetical protein
MWIRRGAAVQFVSGFRVIACGVACEFCSGGGTDESAIVVGAVIDGIADDPVECLPFGTSGRGPRPIRSWRSPRGGKQSRKRTFRCRLI